MELKHPEIFGWSEFPIVNTVYIGGGTPSLLSVSDIRTLLGTINSHVLLSPNIEITIEANPETITEEKARIWKQLGISRISMGIQSMQDKELAFLGRKHTVKQSKEAYELLLKTGFKNINLDVMFGFPNQSVKSLLSTLDNVLKLQPQHISCYNFTLEANTKLGEQQDRKLWQLPSEDMAIQQFLVVREKLVSKGFLAYELSNFALPTFESQHNLNYWDGGRYWGIGTAAHSFQNKQKLYTRWWNVSDVASYIASVTQQRQAVMQWEELSKYQHWNERIMTGLRLNRGVDFERLSHELGVEMTPLIRKRLNSLLELGFLYHNENNNQTYQLSLKGILVMNEIVADLMFIEKLTKNPKQTPDLT